MQIDVAVYSENNAWPGITDTDKLELTILLPMFNHDMLYESPLNVFTSSLSP